MSKVCIFCGNTPQNKNKEHVIPQWLINYTQRAKMPVIMSADDAENKIPFIGFTFPACTACNDKYAAMEAQIKPIMMNIMNQQPISATEINLLLDWFDKVRVGLWLGQLYLDKDLDTVKPHTFIDQRVGYTDRMLIVEKIKDSSCKGIGFTGTGSPIFKYMPCGFQLMINDYVFTNVASHSLVSRKLGFPYATALYYRSNEHIEPVLVKGKERRSAPVVNAIQRDPNTITIYQPIFKPFVNVPLYDTEYVKSHCLDFQAGVGGIFYQSGQSNEIKYLNPDSKLTLNPKPTIEYGNKFIYKINLLQQATLQLYQEQDPQLQQKHKKFNEHMKRMNELMYQKCK